MTKTIQDVEQWTPFHRHTAVSLFNQVWDLMEKETRTEEEDYLMVHKAHASRYHWNEIGEPVHFSRGEWQISRVYAVLNRPEPSLYHAKRNLAICLEHGIGDFDLAFAYEALARAYSICGEQKLKENSLQLAHEAAAHIENKADRNLVLNDLETV